MPRSRDHANHPLQNVRTSIGSATRTGRKSGSISRIAPPRFEARDEIANCRLGVCHVMKNGACSHEVETTRIDRPRDDVALTELNAWSAHIVDKREVEIQRNDLS